VPLLRETATCAIGLDQLNNGSDDGDVGYGTVETAAASGEDEEYVALDSSDATLYVVSSSCGAAQHWHTKERLLVTLDKKA